ASTYSAYTNDSRNHAQVIDGGWGADYPSAADFLGKLTCNHFAPRNGLATTDASEFCDPALDNQIARAAALQNTDPSAAAALWARLDHQLTNLAIWLPTVTPNETDLISARIGNYQYNPVWGALLDHLGVRRARPCATPPAAPPRQALPQQLTSYGTPAPFRTLIIAGLRLLRSSPITD